MHHALKQVQQPNLARTLRCIVQAGAAGARARGAVRAQRQEPVKDLPAAALRRSVHQARARIVLPA